MEIPYIVTPRKDTGLFNSKIAIWLFLASEVMLFGGFFSAYIFLRMGADYPWPERTLPVMPGLLNTFILIASSVTVVFAWASLKLRKWLHFKIYMGITVVCALAFMCFKAMEYNVKFHHQAVRLPDYSIVEGHLAYKLKEGVDPHGVIKESDYELNHHGKKIEENVIQIEAVGIDFSTIRYHKDWVEEMLTQAEHHKSKITLAADIKGAEGSADAGKLYAKAGEPLSLGLLKKIQEFHLAARKHNAALRTAALKQEWNKAHKENPGKKGWQLATNVNVDATALAPRLLTELPAASFKVDPACRMDFKPRDIKEADGSSRLRDDTVVKGKLLPSPMVFHYVDAVDFRYLAMKAKAKNLDPVSTIDNSWLVKNNPEIAKAWAWNKTQTAKLEAELKPHGTEPTAEERYRIGWKEFAAIQEGKDRHKQGFSLKEEFTGPDYETRNADHHHPTFPAHFELPRDHVAFASKFTPSWNTYYAIYFTITGLHGLHVIGGAIVLAYYFFFGRKMYETNPEWLANRVEVAGLFWHFVDLIWIFAFPIFYLM